MKTLKIFLAVLLFTVISFAQDNYTSSYIGEQIDNGVRPYRVYTAFLTQSTSTPSVIVLENSLGNIAWTTDGFGNTTGTLVGAFPENKTIIFPHIEFEASESSYIICSRATDNTVMIQFVDGVLGVEQPFYLEIRVYP